MSLPRTLGELRHSTFSEERLRTRRVKDELRENLIARLRQSEDASIFPGIVGYDDTVVPQIVNAVLSRHNFILLGLRGQRSSLEAGEPENPGNRTKVPNGTQSPVTPSGARARSWIGPKAEAPKRA